MPASAHARGLSPDLSGSAFSFGAVDMSAAFVRPTACTAPDSRCGGYSAVTFVTPANSLYSVTITVNRTEATGGGIAVYRREAGDSDFTLVSTPKHGAFSIDSLATLMGGDGLGTDPDAGYDVASLAGLFAHVPEPATWGLFILGFGMIGMALRRRLRASDAAFTAHVRAIAAGDA